MSKICTVEEAVAQIENGSTVVSAGVIGWVTPDKVLKGISERFEREQAPRDLTFFFPCGTGDAQLIAGMDHVAREGLMKRIVSGSYLNPRHPVTGERPKLMQLIQANKIEAYNWPIGTTMHWLREVGRKSPGYLTHIGLGTFIDPDDTGGKFTALAKDDLVKKVTLEGREYLFYPTWPLNVGIIRAGASDKYGNLSYEDEALVTANIAIAIAVKACGGKVIAQVKNIVDSGTRKLSDVRIPAILVDHVVIDQAQMMVTDTAFDPYYLGARRKPLSQLDRLPDCVDKIISRRASKFVQTGELSIFGFGASGDIPLVMVEDGIITDENNPDYHFTTEHGSFGGIVMSGWQFSANINPEALLDGIYQFDVIDGGLCKFAALAFAEFDSHGVVNVSKFGSANPGSGGFIDIAQSAERLVFTGTFTTGGLEVAVRDAQLHVIAEGKVRKFVTTAQHATYRVRDGVRRGQNATIVTERAVFDVTPDGLVLVEVAPGIDFQTQVLDLMEFSPTRILDPLPLMDIALFQQDFG